jgi:hypothetical protein
MARVHIDADDGALTPGEEARRFTGRGHVEDARRREAWCAARRASSTVASSLPGCRCRPTVRIDHAIWGSS